MGVVQTCQEINFTSINFFVFPCRVFRMYKKHLWGVHIYRTGKSLNIFRSLWIRNNKSTCIIFALLTYFFYYFIQRMFIKGTGRRRRDATWTNVNNTRIKVCCACEECWVIIMTMTRLLPFLTTTNKYNNSKYMSFRWYLNAGGVMCM